MSRKIIAILGAAALLTAACAQSPQSTATEDAVAPASEEIEPAQDPQPAAATTAPIAVPTAQAPVASPRPAPRRPSPVTVPDGTQLQVVLNEDLSSGVNHVGDRFSVEVTDPVMIAGREAIPAGSTVHGTVEEVKKAARGAGNASMTLAFTELELPSGYSTEMSATLSEQTEGKKKRNAAVIGGSAAGGAILGKLIGKDTKGAVVGGLVGGAIGTGIILSKEGAQVELPSGTPIALVLSQPLQVPGS